MSSVTPEHKPSKDERIIRRLVSEPEEVPSE